MSGAARSIDARRLDLDWLRIVAFGLLILYHLGLLYVPWPYHAKSRHHLVWLGPVLEALNPWRLLLLFMISGVATRFMVRRSPALRLFTDRSARLLPPLLFGMLVVVPPQAFVQAVEQYGYGGTPLEFYWHDYLAPARKLCNPTGCLALPTWNHLWFVLYLWIYTTALAVGLAVWARRVGRRGRAVPVAVWLWLPPGVLLAARFVLFSRFPPNDGLFGDWYDHAIYGGAFLLGFVVAEREAFWSATERLRWPAVSAALLLLPSVWRAGGLALPVWADAVAADLAVPLYQWAALLAAFGFGGRLLPRTDGAARRMLTRAVFPFYVVHQTALVVCAHVLRDASLPAAQEAVIILGATVAACFAAYWAACVVPGLGPLLGVARARPGRTVAGAR